MITGKDMNTVFTAIVPLYVAMILAYGSVKWWKILTPAQCSGINRFVSIFAIPLLGFQFISGNNPYEMNVKFILADVGSKLFVLLVLGLWAYYSNRGSFEWMITLFVLTTIPNTLVIGTPLLSAMYGADQGQLTIQAVVLQSAIWYTMLLIMYEFRAARLLIREQFPENAASIVSFKVDSDVMSIDGREPVVTETEVGDNGKLHVKIHRSDSTLSSKSSTTPRVSSLTGAEIYSTHSSVNLTPRESSFSQGEISSPGHRGSNFNLGDVYSPKSSGAPTPLGWSFNEENLKEVRQAHTRGLKSLNSSSSRFPPPWYVHQGAAGRMSKPRSGLAPRDELLVGHGAVSSVVPPDMGSDRRAEFPGAGAINLPYSGVSSSEVGIPVFSPRASENARKVKDPVRVSKSKSKSVEIENAKELHMFVWSESASPTVSDPAGSLLRDFGGRNHAQQRLGDLEEVHVHSPSHGVSAGNPRTIEHTRHSSQETFSFRNRDSLKVEDIEATPGLDKKFGSFSSAELAPKLPADGTKETMPPSSVMIKLICVMTFRKLLHNPNTYATFLGIIWSLVAFRWNFEMPGIIYHSYHILSDAGLGMAMFSLGLFMGLGDRIIACGTKLALLGFFLRFLISPALFAAASYLVGIRGVTLKVCIVQAALPQGIVPFVFAKEYNVHPDILSTAVIFGMLVALPVALLYYILLGL
ncbi:hypothetical protein KC19_12G013300 [Ceratodon purpureus]|uniref:Auxin efflux carrier component n=1 Tax=Ceratodon purpureus TaxID=3225 RepID=A0A8T0G870_CERPU|nr:hypothetical protein KC19_12G013300 [Ceratodon purpureus]